MVITPLCIASMLMATCETKPIALTEGDNAFQIPYEEVDEKELKKEFDEAILSYLPNRELLEKDTYEYLYGYDEYKKEQQRIEEEKRIAEEQKRLAELELKRIEEESKYQAWLNSFDRQDYRQTYYGSFENETSVGAGYSVNSTEVQSINGVYHFNDNEYGLIQVVAISLQEVLNSGQNSRGVWNIYGSIIEMKYPSGEVKNAIILDACSACDTAKKIDLWVSTPNSNFDIQGVDWRIVRKGW